ncbi:MAG: phosphoribosyl-AMP cyclohydrolase [Actinobacteria bacterium]|nr:phosphoribosyl-AMP cyclohydrolase [Actinomycetota bacterium]
MESLADNIFGSSSQLIAAIVQDATTEQVLMLAWMNREAFLLTIETKKATYWSRSRNEIWVKGATSGHTQEVVSMALDCDGDALLLRVNQTGAACHTGAITCFHRPITVGDAL